MNSNKQPYQQNSPICLTVQTIQIDQPNFTSTQEPQEPQWQFEPFQPPFQNHPYDPHQLSFPKSNISTSQKDYNSEQISQESKINHVQDQFQSKKKQPYFNYQRNNKKTFQHKQLAAENYSTTQKQSDSSEINQTNLTKVCQQRNNETFDAKVKKDNITMTSSIQHSLPQQTQVNTNSRKRKNQNSQQNENEISLNSMKTNNKQPFQKNQNSLRNEGELQTLEKQPYKKNKNYEKNQEIIELYNIETLNNPSYEINENPQRNKDGISYDKKEKNEKLNVDELEEVKNQELKKIIDDLEKEIQEQFNQSYNKLDQITQDKKTMKIINKIEKKINNIAKKKLIEVKDLKQNLQFQRLNKILENNFDNLKKYQKINKETQKYYCYCRVCGLSITDKKNRGSVTNHFDTKKKRTLQLEL